MSIQKDGTTKPTLSNREKILARTFKMFINKRLYAQHEFHLFCNWAKGRSESNLLNHLRH